MVGPWCFLDHIGPVEFGGDGLIDVAPHPHIGLQTATWIIEGELLHKDSLGYVQPLRPGALNLMTAGRGISHSEESPADRGPRMHGVQFWIALPRDQAGVAPAFEHHATLPSHERDGVQVTVFVGALDGLTSPATVYSPLCGAELVARSSGTLSLPLEAGFEHGLMVTEGACRLPEHDGPLVPGSLYYLGGRRAALSLQLEANARLMLIGGAPFKAPVHMWWNFVTHSREDIAQARSDWENTDRFGQVSAYEKGRRLEAPAL